MDVREAIRKGDREGMFQLALKRQRFKQAFGSLAKRRRVGVFDNDDYRQEFLRGVWEGTSRVRHDVGCPLEYLIANGLWGVRTAVRKELRRYYIKLCLSCGMVHDYDGSRKCTYCGGCEFAVAYRHVEIEAANDVSGRESIEVGVEFSGTDVTSITIRLIATGACGSGSDIASHLGVSRQRIHHVIKKLKKRL